MFSATKKTNRNHATV